jgi:hypothetical protein
MHGKSLCLLLGMLTACHAPAAGQACDTVGDGWCDSEGVPRYYCSVPYMDPTAPPQWVAVNPESLQARASIGQSCQCLSDAESGRTRMACLVEFHNRGGLCVNGDSRVDNVAPVAAGARLYIHIPAPGCISGDCTPVPDVVRSHCTIQRSGNVLTVDSHFLFEHPFEGLCTSDCRITYATCESDPLPAGQYTIIHGTRQQTLTLPTPGPVPACRRI